MLFAGWILNGYQASVPAFRPIADLTPWSWTANHLPLAGQYDWGSLVPVAIVAIVCFAVGVEAFTRRDLGATSSVQMPSLPAATLGLRGSVARAFGERLPLALAWGLGLGVLTAIALMTAIMALAIGIGFAIGGLRTSIAAEIVALVIATYLIDLIAPPLKLPGWVYQLALTAHMGQPMVGVWDLAGIVTCLALAVGGLLLGGWGMRRRDVAR